MAQLGAMLGSVAGDLLGGFLQGRENSKDRKFNADVLERQIEFAVDMMRSDRKYAAGIRKEDRNWAVNMLRDERDYARRITQDQRGYDRNVLADSRRYAESQTRDDRAYSEKRLNDDRRYSENRLAGERAYVDRMNAENQAYMDRKRDEDIAQYKGDRNAMQLRSNDLAERTAKSRGIDFVKLRDDAIAAGYNPMTALSMAHAYSTQVDYSLQGGVYSPGAAYTAPGALASGGSVPGGSVPSGAVPTGGGGGSPAMAGPANLSPGYTPAGGGGQVSGSGYSSNALPGMSSGSFLQAAAEKAADTFFNTPPERDALADSLRKALDQKTFADERPFGHVLTEHKPFRAAATFGVPALRSDQDTSLAPNSAVSTWMPDGTMEIGGRKFIPVTTSDGKPGKLLKTTADRLNVKPFDTLTAGENTELDGELAEVENAVNYPAHKRTQRDSWKTGPKVGTAIRDYLESGITGNRQFPRGQHYNPWSR